ncbi:CMRF35-like molecule 7 [Choloepus didactylus]|uniref:CMRF35-like molecule 7 n=1 Tax=Choloepus didactylus TaxID=27675 RepID=UPI0018A064C5|nr:CMRF35-like molecule 7 [Choloepus didactylus]
MIQANIRQFSFRLCYKSLEGSWRSVTSRQRVQARGTMWLPSALLLLSLPGCFSIHGPKTVSGPLRGSVTLQCHYDPGWEPYRKWWCQGADWGECDILIITTGTEEEVKKGRVSIKDNHKNRAFTVTMEGLSGKDADTYWCGIERLGTDRGFQVKVAVDPAVSPVNPASSVASLPSTSRRSNSSKWMTSTRPPTRSPSKTSSRSHNPMSAGQCPQGRRADNGKCEGGSQLSPTSGAASKERGGHVIAFFLSLLSLCLALGGDPVAGSPNL